MGAGVHISWRVWSWEVDVLSHGMTWLSRSRHAPLNTVVGNPIKLPKIDNPTQEDVDKWHAVYVEKLIDLFERNKGRFGYKDRELNLI